MLRIFFVSLLLIGLTTSCATAQHYSTKNKKAIKLFEAGRSLPGTTIDNSSGYPKPNFKGGIEKLEAAIEKDPNFLEAHQLAGEFNEKVRNYEKAVYHYKKALEIDPGSNLGGTLYYVLADLQFNNGEYADVVKYADMVLNSRSRAISDEMRMATMKLKDNATFSQDAMANPSSIEPINIGRGINTDRDEYFPTITVDGKTLLFTRDLASSGPPPNNHQEDFFVSNLSDKNIWMTADPMPKNINTAYNEGAPTLGPDGRSLIFIACAMDDRYDYGSGRQGRGSCDLFYTKKIGSKWVNPVNIPGYINSGNWESQPSLSADGRTVYFVRRSGRAMNNNSDIWMSTMDDKGIWGKPVRLPDNINTPFAETSVLIHPDGKTLYFASNGHKGMGGSDIYISRKDKNGNWGNPENLGYPINTKGNENSLLVNATGDVAFFASDRPGGFGGLDIYYFIMPENLRPTKTTYFEGLVYDASTSNRTPIPGRFELIDVETGEQVIEANADQLTGEFMVSLPLDKEYALNVSYPGYAFYSKNFNMKEPEGLEALHMDVPMYPIGTGPSVKLDNVFFDISAATLRKESFAELNKLADFLANNETVKIELGGHTDSRGDADKNQKLSENRAKAVYDYLVSKGIKADRLKYKGYGETVPVYTDETIEVLPADQQEKAHQANRRTEYKFL